MLLRTLTLSLIALTGFNAKLEASILQSALPNSLDGSYWGTSSGYRDRARNQMNTSNDVYISTGSFFASFDKSVTDLEETKENTSVVRGLFESLTENNQIKKKTKEKTRKKRIQRDDSETAPTSPLPKRGRLTRSSTKGAFDTEFDAAQAGDGVSEFGYVRAIRDAGISCDSIDPNNTNAEVLIQSIRSALHRKKSVAQCDHVDLRKVGEVLFELYLTGDFNPRSPTHKIEVRTKDTRERSKRILQEVPNIQFGFVQTPGYKTTRYNQAYFAPMLAKRQQQAQIQQEKIQRKQLVDSMMAYYEPHSRNGTRVISQGIIDGIVSIFPLPADQVFVRRSLTRRNNSVKKNLDLEYIRVQFAQVRNGQLQHIEALEHIMDRFNNNMNLFIKRFQQYDAKIERDQRPGHTLDDQMRRYGITIDSAIQYYGYTVNTICQRIGVNANQLRHTGLGDSFATLLVDDTHDFVRTLQGHLYGQPNAAQVLQDPATLITFLNNHQINYKPTMVNAMFVDPSTIAVIRGY